MGLIANTIRNLFTARVPPSLATGTRGWQGGTGSGPQNYLQFARRGYAGNEIVFSAIELLATSAAEPHIIGRRWRRESPTIRATGESQVHWREDDSPLSVIERDQLSDRVRTETARLQAKGFSLAQVNDLLVSNGFITQLPGHPLVRLLNAPNPFMSRGQCWSTVVMDRYLGGNAYLLKARNSLGGFVQELWRLRPDRVKIIPDKETFCKYEYTIPGQIPITFEYRDVMHFKTRNPLDDYYGMPPMMAISGRLDIDKYMEGFLKQFFEQGGTGPGSILTVNKKVTQEQKDEIRDHFRKQFGGAAGWHEMMILDNIESSYQQLGLNRGLRDALPKELDQMSEARIAMVFGIPGSILGLLIGYESSSYANKRQDWQVLWDVTMTPLLSDLDDVLNLSLIPEFGGIDEVLFDLSDIKALQEDVDKIHDRARKNFLCAGWSWEEFRDVTGMDPNPTEGMFFVPANIMPLKVDALDSPPQPALVEGAATETVDVIAEARCPHCNRLLGRDVSAARFDCPRCKMPVVVENGIIQ